MSYDLAARRPDESARRWARLPRRWAAVVIMAAVIALATGGAALASASTGHTRALGGPVGLWGPVGTAGYAFFYNAPTADTPVAGDGYLQFPVAGAQHGKIVTATGGDEWTFTRAGTYTVAVCVPFQAGGSFYQVTVDGTALPGSSVGGYNQEPYCETVVLSAAAGATLGIQNSQGSPDVVAPFGDSQLLIQQISG
jgi:hypothetical protein